MEEREVFLRWSLSEPPFDYLSERWSTARVDGDCHPLGVVVSGVQQWPIRLWEVVSSVREHRGLCLRKEYYSWASHYVFDEGLSICFMRHLGSHLASFSCLE